MKKSINNLFRWIAVLPGSLIAGFLSTFPLHLLLYLLYAHNGTLFGFIELPEGSNLSIEHAIYPAVAAFIFILVGYKIAPRHKFVTSIVLAILYILFTIGLLLFAEKNNLGVSFEIRSIGPALGLLLGLFMVWRENEEHMRASDQLQNFLKYIFTIMKKRLILTVIASIFLFIAFADSGQHTALPYGYFTLMRFVVCSVVLHLAYLAYEENKKSLWVWAFGFTAVLFNPIFIIHLKRTQWVPLDIVAGCFLVTSTFLFKTDNQDCR
jgi:hypothetical protein